MTFAVSVAVFLAASAVALLHWHGVVAEDQAAEANRLQDWETRLRRSTYGQPLGGCRSLAECERNRAKLDALREAIEQQRRNQ